MDFRGCLCFNPNQGGLLCQSIKWGDQNGTSLLCCPSILKNCPNQPKLVSNESLHLYKLIWVLKFTLCFTKFSLDPAKVAPFQLKNFLSFLSKNGEYLQFFDLLTQYLQQMKAQTNPHSNWIPKIFWKIWWKLDYLQF